MMSWILPHLVLAAAHLSQTTRPADVEWLGQPCRAKQVLGTCMITDRQDGRQRLVLLNDNETHGCELLYIDFENDTGVAYAAPAGAGSWCGIEVPGDRLVIGTFYDGSFLIFDLKAKAFTKVVRFPGEQYVWNLVRAADGRVYGGTYPGAKLGALDLDRYEVEDLGAPVRPNQYLRHVSHAPWGQIFANFGMTTNTTKIYDIKSKSWREVPGLTEGQTFGVGVTWNGYFVAADPRSGKIEAFKDASLTPAATLPFPVPPGEGVSVHTQLTDEKTIYLSQGHAVYRYSAEEPKSALMKIAEIDLRGGRYAGAAEDGSLLGVRGQSYFRVRPGDRELQLKPIPAESRGRPSLFLEADAEGRVWGGPHFGQTLFYWEINTGKSVNTEIICDGGGEVYDVTFHEGRVYAASYAGGDVTCYNPAEPWDQWHLRNPKPAAKVGPEYIRPTGGLVTGPDGKLYAGWMARYGTYGGAVSITDPRTGQTTLIENPLGQQAVAALAVDRQTLYIGTSLGANGLPNQKGQAKVGVVEIASRKVVFEKPADVQAIVVEPRTSLVAFTERSSLWLYDPKSKTIAEAAIPNLPGITTDRLIAPGDGTLLAAADRRIIRIHLRAKTFAVLAEAPERIQHLTLAADRKVYFTTGPDLYRTTRAILPASSD